MDRDLALSGMPAELAATIKADIRAARVDAAECCPIRPDCWDIVMAWRVISGQWRTVSRGGLSGGVVFLALDYTAVAAGLAGMGIQATPDMWWGLRVMEAAAKEELNQ